MKVFLNLEACMIQLSHDADVRNHCLPASLVLFANARTLRRYGKVNWLITLLEGRRLHANPQDVHSVSIKLPQLLRVKRSEPRDPITDYTVTSKDALRHLDVRL